MFKKKTGSILSTFQRLKTIRKWAGALFVFLAIIFASAEMVVAAEDFDRQYVVYVSNQEDRFLGYVNHFFNEFGSSWGTRTQFYYGRCSYLGGSHLSYADSADLCYNAGHGNASAIWFSDTEACSLSSDAWGSYSTSARTADLEYIIFHACKVLQMDTDWRNRWKQSSGNLNKPFSGLHVAAGFWDNHVNSSVFNTGENIAEDFAAKLNEVLSVRLAWYEAVDDNRWRSGYDKTHPAIFYIRPHRDETIYSNTSTDYHYGDSSYLLDAYSMTE